MRLWHYKIISFLPRQQLLGQHRECCALRGNGWGRKHATVNYVFTYSPHTLYQYHMLVKFEMIKRGYNFDEKWSKKEYRGKICPPYSQDEYEKFIIDEFTYDEHDSNYLHDNISNLLNKGVIIDLKADI